MFRLVTPHLRVDSIVELDVDRLRRLELETLLVDVDCTLTHYRSEEVSAEVAAWLKEVRSAGIGLCLVSNGGGRRIRRLAQKLGLPFVGRACKPLPFGCREAIRRMGVRPERTAMVGDQLFADVMAGRLAGLFSILVRPIRPEEEPWFTRMKRPWERCLLRRICRDGEPERDRQ